MLETELPKAIELMNTLLAQKNLASKLHLMSGLCPDSPTQMQYLEITVFKATVVCSVRWFYWDDKLFKNRKDGVTLNLVDVTHLQQLLPLLHEDLNQAERVMHVNRGRDDETECWIKELEQSQGVAPVGMVQASIAPNPGPIPGPSGRPQSGHNYLPVGRLVHIQKQGLLFSLPRQW